MTTDDIYRALDAYFYARGARNGHSMAIFGEVRMGTGYGRRVDQRIDYFAMNLWPSSGLTRKAFEIKASRSDFLRELKDPLKRRCALLVSNQFYFAAPEGLIRPDELPVEAGLVEIMAEPDGIGDRLKWTVDAPWRDTIPPTWAFFASIARRAMEQSEMVKALREQYEKRPAVPTAAQGALL
jgi:hypothetical protein